MRGFLYSFITFLAALMLGACAERSGQELYDYLMLHPYQLRSAIDDCRLVGGNSKQSHRCATVMKAANSMALLIERQQQNPEQFGRDVLSAQTELWRMQDVVAADRKKVREYEKNNQRQLLVTATNRLSEAEDKTAKLAFEVKVMLAVIGLSSPE